MSLENVMRLVQQMSVEERIEAARMVLGGRVRHLVCNDGKFKFFVHGHEYSKFPDVYEIIVGNDHYYGESFEKVAAQVAICYIGDREYDVSTFINYVWDKVKFEPVEWLKYPRWNRDAWDTF